MTTTIIQPAATPDFTQYVAAHRSAWLAAAYQMTGDRYHAEDLVQSALASVYLAWPRIREARAIDAYVRQTMRHQHASWWRRQSWRTSEHSTAEPPEPSTSSRAAAAGGPSYDERASLWQLVQTLPPKQRHAVVLRYYEDLSEAEAARILRCSVGTVKSNTSRGLASLRQRAGTLV